MYYFNFCLLIFAVTANGYSQNQKINQSIVIKTTGEFRLLKKADILAQKAEFFLGIDNKNVDSNYLWYVSFSQIEKEVLALQKATNLPRDFKLYGQFEHDNFAEYSFVLHINYNSQQILKKALQTKKMYSIWDYVDCGEVTFNIVTKGQINYLFLTQLNSCKTVWDD